MNTLFFTLFRPVKAFNQLKPEPFSIMSLVVILLLMLLNLILMIPVSEKILQITVSSMSLPQNQIDMMVQVARKMQYLQIAGTGILYIIMFLFYAFLLYLIVRFLKRIDYKKALQLFVCCYLIIAIGDLVNTAFIYMRGIDTIKNMYDTSLTGLNLLSSVEQIGAVAYTLLSYITPFQLGFVVLLSIGLKIFIDVKYAQSLVISILFWLITILIPVLSVYFSQLTAVQTGVI